jgi:hypothetical protein
MRRRPTACLFVASLLSYPAFGQSGSISGAITDPDGGVVKDAVVQARNSATGQMIRVTSSAEGEYRIELQPGIYEIAVPMPCCQWGSFSQKDIAVEGGKPRRLDIHLPWGANLGTLGDDPILLLNDFRERAAVPSGPAPRTREGVPDLSGMWINAYDNADNAEKPPPSLQPWAAELLRQRRANNSKDYPGGFCLPASAAPITRAFPYKFVQTPSLIVVLHESDTPGYRQIFLDGRGHPKDIDPTWEGHSIGHWDGDTLVVDTAAYNDKSWLSLSGVPHTEKLHTVERIRRPDYGHLQIEIVMDDSEAFTAPWKRTLTATLAPPGDEITEFICAENNRDPAHYR